MLVKTGDRERLRSRPVTSLAGMLVLLASCLGPEQELVTRFLQAAETGDRPTIAHLSARGFDEQVDSWEILEMVDAPTTPYAVPALREAVNEAERARDEQFKIYSEFRQTNYDRLAEIQKLQQNNPEHQFRGRLEELRVEWESQRSDRREKVRLLQEAEIRLADEVKTVSQSLQRESTPEYLRGEVLNKSVAVRVMQVGEPRDFKFTISKYELINQFDAAVPSRWLITRIDAEP